MEERSLVERRKGSRRILRVAVGVLVLTIGYWVWDWVCRRSPVAPTDIFQGVTYGCDRLESDSHGNGLVHWVRIDLSATGVELYATPLDPAAVRQGWQYRLKTTSGVVENERLAVGINAGLFAPKSRFISLPGDLARSVETMIADHNVSHVGTTSYLLWFSDDLSPVLETSKTPAKSVLDQARWGVAGQGVGLRHGILCPSGMEKRDPRARTGVGINRERKQLFLVTFECATPERAYEKLAALGIQDGMLLDGGESTAMTLGNEAHGVRSGTLIGGWRPVATHFGVRAKPLSKQ